MADNTTLNAGSGGDVIGSDDIGGVKFQRVKLIHGADGVNAGDVSAANALPTLLQGQPASSWPNYSGPDSQTQRTANIDDDGALIVRGAVLTDEGTFRCNFANTSLWAGIGSVTVSGTTVTGTGFLVADVHYNDYFKIAADADTLAVQIASIDSDTQITLKAAYAGSASGTGNRAIMLPVTGAGGSITVASGQATITAGTTAASQTGLVRFVDYGPLVGRSRFRLSQRIANQTFRVGLRELAATPRWFAWFVLDGTTNTTLKCQTARNPTGAPSAAETQETTVTLPNGATTATAREGRVELLTESVRFYIDGVLVAEHTITIPHQHDEMAKVAEFVNGTTPATSTTATIDFVTCKNHNKVEIGVMSDAEKIVASQPPVRRLSFSQAGVIAINTILLEVDCTQLRGLSLHIVSLGTTGQITAEWRNDPADTWVTASMMTASAATNTNLFTLAGMFTAHVAGGYFRLRLSSATTAGTTTLRLLGYEWPIGPFAGTSISGAVTIGTNAALVAGTARIGNVAGAGIWYDDSSAALAANATFTGTSRDATVTATATAFANAATYAKEVRVSAESDQTGTLWLEVSRDNTNWRRAKSVATAAVTGGGFYAEIVHAPSWRYWRCGFTNGATLQTRFTIGSIATAL